eukprot:7890836-Karenia_brevis.AAC.1
MDKFLGFFVDDVEDKHRAGVQLMKAASRLYLAGSYIVELTFLVQEPRFWADTVPRDSHPPE